MDTSMLLIDRSILDGYRSAAAQYLARSYAHLNHQGVSAATRAHDHEESCFVCDVAFQMANEGIKAGRRRVYDFREMVTAQVAMQGDAP